MMIDFTLKNYKSYRMHIVKLKSHKNFRDIFLFNFRMLAFFTSVPEIFK